MTVTTPHVLSHLSMKLIDSERVFSISVVGTPAVLRTYDKLGQRCIPQDDRSGHPALGDPVNHPWTPGTTFSYTTEAVLWGTFIEQHLEDSAGRPRSRDSS